jgi:hypothetical protein
MKFIEILPIVFVGTQSTTRRRKHYSVFTMGKTKGAAE